MRGEWMTPTFALALLILIVILVDEFDEEEN